MYDRTVASLAETNRPTALRHPMLDLLNPDTLKQVVATALTDNVPVLEFTDGRVYTLSIRPTRTLNPAPAVPADALGSWIAGHVRACLATSVLDAAAYQVTVAPAARFRDEIRQAA